jgi:hypothetical protein
MLRIMSRFSQFLTKHLESLGKSRYWLVNQYGGSAQYIYAILRGEKLPGDEVLVRLSKIQSIGLSLETLRAWRSLDEDSDKTFLEAFKARFNTPEEIKKFCDLAIESIQDDENREGYATS